MNSTRAAAVRDAINGCPAVVSDDDVVERDGEPFRTSSANSYNGAKTLTGDRLDTSKTRFKPAYIEQTGTIGNGNGAERPVYVVALESLWTQTDDARSLPPEMVYEAAKHDCRIRFYPPEHRLGGAVWFTDHFSQSPTDTNGERCTECGSTYFKIRDGTPECARCGADEESVQTKLTEMQA